MDQFGDIFTPPESPNPDYNPRENMLRCIQDMDEAGKEIHLHKTIHEPFE